MPRVNPRVIYGQYGIPQGTRATNATNSQAVTAFEEQYISISGDLKVRVRRQGPLTRAFLPWGDVCGIFFEVPAVPTVLAPSNLG